MAKSFLILYLFSLKATYLMLLMPINIKPPILSSECKAIVVLGGRDDYDRILKGLELSQHNPEALLIFSGVHDKYKTVVDSFDVQHVIFEDRSKNSYENAVNTKKYW